MKEINVRMHFSSRIAIRDYNEHDELSSISPRCQG